MKKLLIFGISLALLWVVWLASGYGIHIGNTRDDSLKARVARIKRAVERKPGTPLRLPVIYCRYITAIGIEEVKKGNYDCPRGLF